jgi:hypothetical protein
VHAVYRAYTTWKARYSVFSTIIVSFFESRHFNNGRKYYCAIPVHKFLKKHRCTSELIKVCSIKSSSVAFLIKIRNDQRTSNSMGLDSFPALSVLFLQKYCSFTCILATISCTESKLWENLGRKSLPFLCVGSHQG